MRRVGARASDRGRGVGHPRDRVRHLCRWIVAHGVHQAMGTHAHDFVESVEFPYDG